MRNEKLKVLLLRTIGNFLILTSLLGVVMVFGPALKAEVSYRWHQVRGIRFVLPGQQEKAQPQGFFSIFGPGSTEVIEPVDVQFSIVIPKINANAKVVPNVDAGNYKEYMAALKQGVAHAKGTKLPGTKGNMYLFAHSTDNVWNVGRYNAVFYLLKELEKDDTVHIFFNGWQYDYKVFEKSIVAPDQVQYLTEQPDDYILTLQTCYPPGTTWKRLIIRAKLLTAQPSTK
ncbi:MAG TPA: sortase [Patescibacteria group bacterium]|nr:sortase [Patescibacteria group bacterium]